MEKGILCWFCFLTTHNCNMVLLRGTLPFCCCLTQNTANNNRTCKLLIPFWIGFSFNAARQLLERNNPCFFQLNPKFSSLSSVLDIVK